MTPAAASMSATITKGLAITNPLVKYRALVATKQIVQDPAQIRLALHLQKLYEDLKDYEPQVEYSARIEQIARTIDHESRDQTAARLSPWRALIAAKEQRDSLALTKSLTSHETAMNLTSPKGLMLHGEVGTGKSMLIDLFADCLPTKKKRRWHFNTFMLETLAKLESLRKSRVRGVSPINPENDSALLWLAKDMIQESPILFLDEFQMPDRAASKILTNLMTSFFQLGGVLIATSNRMPEELAKAAGLEFAAPKHTGGSANWSLGPRQSAMSARFAGRGEFAAFLDVLKARCDVWEMDGKKDYRRAESSSIAARTFDPDTNNEVVLDDTIIGSEGPELQLKETDLPQNYRISTDHSTDHEALDTIVANHSSTHPITLPIMWQPATMYVYGRTVTIPQTHEGISKWTFQGLCNATLGPADYITLASTYHTLVLTDVPVLTWLMKNEARRFITLLDALYESRCKLLVSAAAGPDHLFFPEQTQTSSPDSSDSVYSETLSEVYQDATAPFRPNILSQNPNYAEPDPTPDYTHARLAGLLAADALEDDPPNRPSHKTSSSSPFARSFGRTDAEMDRAPIDPDEPSRWTARSPDFSRTSAFTGEDERFAYKRAESRLWELCGAKWWARGAIVTTTEHTDKDKNKDSRGSVNEWHRPLPIESRRWETPPAPGIQVLSAAADWTMTDAAAAPGMPGNTGIPSPEISSSPSPSASSGYKDVSMGAAVEDSSRDERSFRIRASSDTTSTSDNDASTSSTDSSTTPYSPFRTATEAPPKFNFTHFWGTTIWGRKAGPWGQGPEGLKDRRKSRDGTGDGSGDGKA